MTKVHALWFGGSGYSAPLPDDLEVFTSLKDAREALEERYMDRWRRQRFNYVFKEALDVGTPAVDEQTYIKCWLHLVVDPDMERPDLRELPEPDRYVVLTRTGRGRVVEYLPDTY